jgi:choline dehydrogenase-like flavoprotein
MLTALDRSTIATLFATFAPPGADATRGVETIVDALGRLAPHRRSQLVLFVRLLAPLGALPHGARESILRSLADSPVATLRTGFQAFKRLALFGAYAVADERGANPLWPALGYPGPRADRPASATTVPAFVRGSGRRTADAVVVGSGAGGGVAAALLAQAGMKVVVLEAGPLPDATMVLQREADAFASLYLDSGLTSSADLAVAILAGACVGGGTTVNWTTSLRLRPNVAAQWDGEMGVDVLATDLAASYAAVEARLGVETATEFNRNNRIILDGAQRLGWSATGLPRNAGCEQPGCGYCGFGCAYGNKRGTAITYLRDAVAAGAEIYAETPVTRVRIERGAVIGVDAGDLQIDAPLVVVAAGALRTPGVLARSGIRNPHLGRHLHLHPTTALTAEFDEPVEAWHGAMQSALCDEFTDQFDAYGSTIETAPAHPGLMALALPWRSQAQHASEMQRGRNSATLIALTRDRGEGRVSLDGKDDITYALAGDDGARMLAALAGAAELAFAAGARRVATLHARPLELTRERATPSARSRFAAEISASGHAANRLAVFSAHQMGTARMHCDPAGGVTDPLGRVHGVDGLLVADSSVFPLASGVNPMLTIMALAHRAVSARVPAAVR